MTALLGWLGEQRRVYFGNPASVRDFRAQMRGLRAPVILLCYLLLLILIAGAFYSSLDTGQVSPSRLQFSLNVYLTSTLGTLEVLMALLAPALAATTVVSEYERKSLDLLFSSPLTPKSFIIGKFLSAARYSLMLLALSFPVTAVAVVLGGATWIDFLAAYALIACRSLVYCAVGVLFSVMTWKVVTAVGLTYVAQVGYFVFGMTGMAASMGSMSGGGTDGPVTMALVPGLAIIAAPTTSIILGQTVPNWIYGSVILLLLVRLLLVGAGSALTAAGSPETKSLRIHGLVFTALLGTLAGASGGTVVPFGGGSPALGAAQALFWPLAFAVLFLPYLATWGMDGGSKVRPNGLFQPKWLLHGSPASGLPYWLAFLGVWLVSALVAGRARFFAAPVDTFAYVALILATALFGWSLGWAAAGATGRQSASASRRLHVALVFLLTALPASITAMFNLRPDVTWFFSPFAGIQGLPQDALIKAGTFFMAAVVLTLVGEKLRLARTAALGATA
jgi:ABC-type transport system involved in multi-copper enzyme maturation permease subunit